MTRIRPVDLCGVGAKMYFYRYDIERYLHDNNITNLVRTNEIFRALL